MSEYNYNAIQITQWIPRTFIVTPRLIYTINKIIAEPPITMYL